MKAWASVALGDIFTIARGGSPRPIDNFITDDPSGVNWIMIGDAVEGSKYIASTKKRIRPEGVSRSREVRPGDFLLTNSMSFGHPYILATSGCIHDGWLVLSPRDKNVDQDYFYHLLGSPLIYAEFERLAAGAVVKNLNSELVRGVRVPLPPLPEQRRIADILDKADALRRRRREAIVLTEELIRSTFLEMFGDPVTNPKGWSVRPLGDLAQVQGGLQVTHARASLPLDVPYLRVANVYRDAFALGEIKRLRVTDAELERVRLRAGDILVVEGHGNPDEIGRSAVWQEQIPDCVHQNHLIRVRCGADARPIFVSAYLNSEGGRRQMRVFGKTTSGLNTISTNNVKNTTLIVPPLALQDQYANLALRNASMRERMRAYGREADALFDSLVHRAFSGELADA